MEINIRQAEEADLERILYIENACFPAAEAAACDSLKERLVAFQHSFLVAERQGEIIGFINGCVTKQRKLTDDLYTSTKLHDDSAPYQMVFGLDVLPTEQHQGIAILLMKKYIEIGRKYGKELITLTCKKRLIHFYEQFGYQCEGKSTSVHGGAEWYDMTLLLKR